MPSMFSTSSWLHPKKIIKQDTGYQYSTIMTLKRCKSEPGLVEIVVGHVTRIIVNLSNPKQSIIRSPSQDLVYIMIVSSIYM